MAKLVDPNNPAKFEKPVLGVIGFFFRQLFASFVVVAVGSLIWTAIYISLLLWAVFSNSGIGGPLAYPAGLLFVVVASAVSVLVLLFPSSATAELIARRRNLPVLLQIPISVGFLALFCLGVVGIARLLGSKSIDTTGFFATAGIIFAVELLPLALYWWMAQGGPVIMAIVKWFKADKRP